MNLKIVFLILLCSLRSNASYTCSLKEAQSNKCKDLIKLNTDAGLGKCLPEIPSSKIQNILSHNRIKLFTGNNPALRAKATQLKSFSDHNDPRVLAVSKALNAIDKIGDGRMTALEVGEPIHIVFARKESKASNSRRFGNQIQLTAGNQNNIGTGNTSTSGGQDNIALMVHEIAHFVAAKENGKILKKYSDFLKGRRCKLTSYCTGNVTEEFAEVFAAYITMPQAFNSLDKLQSKNCDKAFAFMKELFGEPKMTKSCDARKNSLHGH